MIYVKKKFNDGAEINVPVQYNNVYTRCPVCGVEHKIDLTETIRGIEAFDIETSTIYCERCSVHTSDNT